MIIKVRHLVYTKLSSFVVQVFIDNTVLYYTEDPAMNKNKVSFLLVLTSVVEGTDN